jgi:ParB family chromosome partitioning protein
MGRKINFDEELGDAVQEATQATNRFARAQEVLRKRPTGYVNMDGPEVPVTPSHAAAAASAVLVDPSASVESFARETLPALPDELASRLGSPQHMKVPLDLIDDNPYNARSLYKPEKVAETARSMAANSQLVPGVAVRRGDRFVLIAGHYRKKGAKVANIPFLHLMVYENVSDQDLYRLSYIENAERNDQTALDNAMAWKRLLDEGVYSSEVELAEALGLSKANVNKTVSVMNLDRTVLDIIEQKHDLYGLTVLYELMLLQKAASVELAVEMATRVQDQGIGRKEIAMARERAGTKGTMGGRKRVNETSRSYRFWNPNSNTQIGTLREWDSGKIALEVNFGGDEKEKTAFIEYIRKRFSSSEPAPDDEGGAN